MATLTLRSAKGSPLTNNEVDANFTNLNTDKYESGNNAVFGTLSGTTVSATTVATTGSLTVGGSSTLSATTAVSAAGNAGVKLPDCAAGLETFLLNDTSNNLKVYPLSGETIDGGGSGIAVDLAPGHSLKLVGVSATKWNRLSPVIIYNSSGTRVN
jgi:hypothetical protein